MKNSVSLVQIILTLALLCTFCIPAVAADDAEEIIDEVAIAEAEAEAAAAAETAKSETIEEFVDLDEFHAEEHELSPENGKAATKNYRLPGAVLGLIAALILIVFGAGVILAGSAKIRNGRK